MVLAVTNVSSLDISNCTGQEKPTTNCANSNSSRESRSGLDPPAKSPAIKQSSHKDEGPSMIRETPSFESKYDVTNASLTSEVTGFTVPRTPVWKSAHTPPTARSKTSNTVAFDLSSMDEKLLSIARETRSKLDGLWDTIGSSRDDRSSQLYDVVSAFSTICAEKILQEERVAEGFRAEIGEMKEEYDNSCAALGMDNELKLRRDPSTKDDVMTLQCEHESVLARLENVREVVAVAKEDLSASQERIFEAVRALTGSDDSRELEEWEDVETDLTERRREDFRTKALELEESVKSRTRAVVSLTVDCQNLIRELDIQEEQVGHCEDDVKIMNGLQSVVRGENAQSPHNHHRGRNRSSDNFTILSLFESSNCMGISNSALERLTRRLAELNDEKQRRRNVLSELGTTIHSLWAMLRVPFEEQKAFTDTVRGLGMETIHKGEKELARLQELKSAMIEKLIRDQRKKIEELWRETNATETEKASFGAYFHIYDDDKMTEELLTTHQEYTSLLNDRLEKMRPILDLIVKRETIVSERFELEELQKDPGRLKGRHACQQLAKEEKMHRRVKNELPRITNHLEKILQKWYQDNRPSSTEEQEADPTLGHFLYQGAPYLETMHTQEHDWRMRKELEEQERQRKRDERKSKQNSFGSSFSKLPGQKWKPSIGSTTTSSTTGSYRADTRPRSASNARAYFNQTELGRPLADISGSRDNAPRPPSRTRHGDKPLLNRNNIPGHYRAASAPRQRF